MAHLVASAEELAVVVAAATVAVAWLAAVGSEGMAAALEAGQTAAG